MASGEKWLKKSGDSIGAFVVLSPIGSGGMGQVENDVNAQGGL